MIERDLAVVRALRGRTIADVVVDAQGEAQILLEGGLVLLVSSDQEGNGPGALHVYDASVDPAARLPRGRRESGLKFLGILGGR